METALCKERGFCFEQNQVCARMIPHMVGWKGEGNVKRKSKFSVLVKVVGSSVLGLFVTVASSLVIGLMVERGLLKEGVIVMGGSVAALFGGMAAALSAKAVKGKRLMIEGFAVLLFALGLLVVRLITASELPVSVMPVIPILGVVFLFSGFVRRKTARHHAY